MRILFIHNRYRTSYGGEDATVEAEMKLLTAKGQEVNLLLFDNADIGEGIGEKLSAGVRSAWNTTAAAKVKKDIEAFKPDVVHVHNFFFMASPSVLVEVHRHKIPVIVTLQNYRLICVNALLLRNNQVCELCVQHTFPWWGVKYRCYHNSVIESAMVGAMSAIHKIAGTWRNKVDAYITPSAFSRSKLINSSLKIAPEKIVVKRNFIEDPGVASPESRSSFYLFVGRLSKEKGIHFLLDCFSKLPGEELLIAGEGPEQEELVNTYGHLPNIKFLGKKSREEIIDLMKTCRALLFPSLWYEGAPVTIIESFATGTPVIASRLGAMQEMIDHNRNGLLFDVNSEEGLKNALTEMNKRCLQQDPILHKGARHSYITTYHPDQCYKAVMDIYEDVIKNARRPLSV